MNDDIILLHLYDGYKVFVTIFWVVQRVKYANSTLLRHEQDSNLVMAAPEWTKRQVGP